MNVDYKGCVNFYKPYNIEFDCVVDYEDDRAFEKVRKAYKKHKEREEKVKNRGLEIYSEIIQNEWVDADFSSIQDYLWIDVSEELTRNYYKVSRLLPSANKEFFEGIEKRAIAQALQENPWEEIPTELLQWDTWDDELLKQLEEARKPKVVVKDYTYSYESTIKPWWREEWKKEKEEKEEEKVEEIIGADLTEEDVEFFNKERFPEARMLRMNYNIPTHTEIYATDKWIRMVYDYYTNEDMTFAEYLEYMQQMADEEERLYY